MSAAGLLSKLLNKCNGGTNRPPGLISRNVTVCGRRTSMRLEASLWDALNEICRRECVRTADICARVAAAKSSALTLTAALRVFIANYFRDAATEEGHARAGHGVDAGMQAITPAPALRANRARASAP
jgi:predicted DNA-binding ribbon-helix-helix protein